MLKLFLIILTLTPLLFSQSCSASRSNSSCSNSIGYGVCCQYNGGYSCFAGFDKCCGYDGLCRAGFDCCPAAYGKDSLCLRGYRCCNAGRNDMYYCDSGMDCCAGGCCTYQFAGWLIAVIVVGAVAVVAAIGFIIYKKRQSRMRIYTEGGYHRDIY